MRLEESGQWLENVEQTHLVLAGGKPALQIKVFSVNKVLSRSGTTTLL